MGFKNAITIDSDGQHYPEDIHLFIDAAKKKSWSINNGLQKHGARGYPWKKFFW